MTIIIVLFSIAILCFVIAAIGYIRLTWDAPLPDYTSEELEEQARQRNEETAIMAGVAATIASL